MSGLKRIICPLFVAAAVLGAQDARAGIDPEDQKLIDAAGCPELLREYANYANAERAADAQIHSAKAGIAAANVAGIAAFATLGFGFFHWDDHSDAEENLAELRAIRIAIGEGIRKKACSATR